MRIVEGVPWYRFSVRFRTVDGRRVRWMRWSPGAPWVYSEIERELEARGFYPETLKGGGYSLEHAP